MADPTIFAEKDNGNDVPLEMAARLDITDLNVEETQKWWIIQPRGSGQMPYDLFISDSFINNELQEVLPGERSRGILYGGPAHFRLYLDNTTFNVPAPRPSYRADGFNKYALGENPRIRLRNSQDQEGRVSDAAGTYTSDSTDEGNDYVLIPTSLMSRAQERSATVISGARSVTGIEVANADGTPRPWDPGNPQESDQRDPYLKVNLDGTIQPGNTITVDWTARVTPLDQYRATGVFTSRPVADQSLTTNDGSLTIDLRGVAASQESKQPIEYAASSESADVAAVSVGDNGYVLTVTPQNPGTTVVTVTGSIDGIGGATTTFNIDVE
jgi:hypothetical protein